MQYLLTEDEMEAIRTVAETEARIVEWLRSRVYAFRNAAQVQGKRPGALVAGYEAAADAIARREHVTGEKDRG